MLATLAAQPSITDSAYNLRAIAEAGPIGKRHSSFELYNLLAQCMALAERCEAGNEYGELRSLVAKRPKQGRNRTYVERGSDSFILVCRFVFGDLKTSAAQRSNASRYAHCLRQAQKCGIASGQLAQHLAHNGGVNALFLVRPLMRTNVTTKCLNLTESVTVPKDRPVTLTLQRTDDNRFRVLSVVDA